MNPHGLGPNRIYCERACRGRKGWARESPRGTSARPTRASPHMDVTSAEGCISNSTAGLPDSGLVT